MVAHEVFEGKGFLSGVDWGIVAGFLGLLGAVVVAGGVAYVYLKRRKENKRYTVAVEILTVPKGSSQPIKKFDRGGIFFRSKPNLKRFWLKNHKVGLNPDNVPFIFNDAGGKIVTLFQGGLSEWRYVDVQVNPNPGVIFAPGEEDVNWAIAAYREFKNFMPDKKTFLAQYGWIFLWVFTIGATMVLLIVLFNKFDVLASVASSMNAASQRLANAQLGTVVG